MASSADLVRGNPTLSQFLVGNVQPTGRKIGSGSFGSVEEVKIPGATCAAKRIHDILQDRSRISEEDIQKAIQRFGDECQLMSTLRHPHIVQFLGICYLPGSRLPALVMEQLVTSLHDLLENQPGIPLGLKCSFLHDVASGLDYLHSHSPPVIHRDVSARNVLLNTGMVAKLADLGVARIMPSLQAATMTQVPGAFIYMPPEALEDKSRYDTTIDIFSLGVVAIFVLTQRFPRNVLAPVYRDSNQKVIVRSELQRRGEYTQQVYGQLRPGHPLILMMEQCLESFPEDRPAIRQVLQHLERAKDETGDPHCNLNKLELMEVVKGLHTQLQSFEKQLQARDQSTVQVRETHKDEVESESVQVKSQDVTGERGAHAPHPGEGAQHPPPAEDREPLSSVPVTQAVEERTSKPTKPVSVHKELIEYKVVIVGTGGVGKSALVIRFVEGVFAEEIDPTIEDAYRKLCEIDDERVILDILDTAGQEEFPVMREQYMRAADGFLLVYSVLDRNSLDEVNAFYRQILRVKDREQFPMILVAAKCDVEDRREVSHEGEKLAQELKIQHIKTSARLDLNVKRAFHGLVRAIQKETSYLHVPTPKQKHKCTLQ